MQPINHWVVTVGRQGVAGGHWGCAFGIYILSLVSRTSLPGAKGLSCLPSSLPSTITFCLTSGLGAMELASYGLGPLKQWVPHKYFLL